MDPNQSSFEIVTPSKSKKGSKGLIIAIVVVVFLALGILAGVLLVRQRQQISEKAAGKDQCPGAEACPYAADPSLLRNCHPPDTDNTPQDSLCNSGQVKRVEFCGTRNYCCNGTRWVTDMSACQSATSTATATATATTTATATSIATATATSTSTASSTKSPTPTPTRTSTALATATTGPTKAPIPDTGTNWPTYLGAGLGIMVIVGSFLLAF